MARAAKLGLDYHGKLFITCGVSLDCHWLLLLCSGESMPDPSHVLILLLIIIVNLIGCFTYESLEVWYFMAIILFAGYLKNAEVSVAALSIW